MAKTQAHGHTIAQAHSTQAQRHTGHNDADAETSALHHFGYLCL